MFCPRVVRLPVLVLAAGLGFGLAQLASAHEPEPANARGGTGEAAFLAENDAAMAKMMNGMAIKPTGDVDRDFALMMIPHHQGGIDMALAQLRHGKNELLRRLAAAERSMARLLIPIARAVREIAGRNGQLPRYLVPPSVELVDPVVIKCCALRAWRGSSNAKKTFGSLLEVGAAPLTT